MMTVERFKFEYMEEYDEWELQLDDDGDYVDYVDYLKLEAENETLVAENETLKAEIELYLSIE